MTISEAGARARKALAERPVEPAKPPRRGVPVLLNFRRQSARRCIYLHGWNDRRAGIEFRGAQARGYEIDYAEGWRDGERIARVAKPNPLPSWITDLIGAEDEAREGRAA